MSRAFLLDTCALLFAEQPDARFRRAEQQLQHAEGRLLVSPFSAWELGMLTARGRIALGRPPADWFNDFLQRGAELAPLTPEILAQASALPHCKLRDPADQIIAATARALGVPVVTRDRLLLEYAEAGWMKALPC